MPSRQGNRLEQHSMEFHKKFGKSSWAKHLRNKKKSPFTKQMANKKSRTRMKLSIRNEKLIS